MEKNRSKAVECFNLMVTEPYYMFHFLAFFSYLVFRSSTAHLLLPHINHHLFYRVLLSLSLCVYRFLSGSPIFKMFLYSRFVFRKFKRFWRSVCWLPSRCELHSLSSGFSYWTVLYRCRSQSCHFFGLHCRRPKVVWLNARSCSILVVCVWWTLECLCDNCRICC